MKHPRIIALFILALITASRAIAQTPAPTSATVITDPAQIISKEKFDVQPLSMEKLFMSHSIGDSVWSPDGKQVAFTSNMSGRRNIWLVPAQSGWPIQLTVSNERQTSLYGLLRDGGLPMPLTMAETNNTICLWFPPAMAKS